jgi:hypothetical protein
MMHWRFLHSLILFASSSLSYAFISHFKTYSTNHNMQSTFVAASPSPTEEKFRIGYASDIEGHWDYFLDYVSRSNVLDWEAVDSLDNPSPYKFHQLRLRPGAHFIYGGDSVDKGPGDIRFTRALVDLKQRYPTRVHLLVGNRDLNKLRFRSELGDYEMSLPVDQIKKPFWDEKAMGYREFLEKISRGRSIDEMNTKVNKLKWMLEHTLGCPTTFEFRRQEIGILKHIYGQYPLDYKAGINISSTVLDDIEVDKSLLVSDEQVVESFEHEINHPKGSLRQYLKHASIAAIVGNTIFVHGAIDALTMKFVPSSKSKFELPTSLPLSLVSLSHVEPSSETTTTNNDETMVENVHEWANSLNDYLRHGLQDFEARPDWNSDRTSRGGEALLAIQNRPSMWGRSVVCNSYGDGGVIATSNSEEEQNIALEASIVHLNPLVFEGVGKRSIVWFCHLNKYLFNLTNDFIQHSIQLVMHLIQSPRGGCWITEYNG